MRFTFALILMAVTIGQGWSQYDSLTFTFSNYVENISRHHPLAKKADLKTVQGEAEQRSARGGLDPVLTSGWNQKNFDNKLYYQQFFGEVSIPTPIGVDVKAGYENSKGLFLNPENTTDQFGLWYAGLEVDVLQGLLVNERRTHLRQAEVFLNLTLSERQSMLNDLIYDAGMAYLNWQQFERFDEILTENRDLANTYYQNTTESFINGEKSAMDTLEAYILFQDAINKLKENQTKVVKARMMVNTFLWFEDEPVDLENNVVPEMLDGFSFNRPLPLDSLSIQDHPWIQLQLNELSYLEIGQQLKREKLKPTLSLKYNLLLPTSEQSAIPQFNSSDYIWGFDFSMPLLFRRERGDAQIGELKIREIELEIENTRNELLNELRASQQEQQILREQLDLLRQNVVGYKQLLDGENEKFRLGESSVFLLNKRQEKYIDGELKLAEVTTMLLEEILSFHYYSNNLLNF